MSPGEWIAAASLVLTLLGVLGGGTWWLAYRDAQGQASIKSQGELKKAMVALTDATNKATTAIGSLEDKLETHERRLEEYQERVDREQGAMWKKLDMIFDHLFNRNTGS